MLKLYSPKRATRTIKRYGNWIDTVAARYQVPAAAVKAILYQEMTQIDLFDPLADIAASIGAFGKKDSSTGKAQIFGYVGLNAINFAVDRGMTTYEQLDIATVDGRRLDAENPDDVRLVWRRLRHDPKTNIEVATMNMLVAADEMTGRIDYSNFSDEELMLAFTRYNANVKHVTDYGRRVFGLYQQFLAEEGA